MSTAEIHFWIIAAILVALILGILFWPILHFKRSQKAPREAYDINVYKDQLLEIETDLERGLLSLDQGEAARTEIKRRMLAAVDRGSTQSTYTKSEFGGVILAFFSISVPFQRAREGCLLERWQS